MMSSVQPLSLDINLDLFLQNDVLQVIICDIQDPYQVRVERHYSGSLDWARELHCLSTEVRVRNSLYPSQ